MCLCNQCEYEAPHKKMSKDIYVWMSNILLQKEIYSGSSWESLFDPPDWDIERWVSGRFILYYFHNNLMMLIGFPIKITYFLTDDDYNQIRIKIFTLWSCGPPDLAD